MTLFTDYITQHTGRSSPSLIPRPMDLQEKRDGTTRILNKGARVELHFWKDVANINCMFAEIRLNLSSCSLCLRAATQLAQIMVERLK